MQVDEVGTLLVRYSMDVWLSCGTDLTWQVSPIGDWECETLLIGLVDGFG